jgi:ABC-type branched-subunit amino acid transport system substrate-binding protein
MEGKRLLVVLAGLVLTLGAGACGDDSGDQDEPKPPSFDLVIGDSIPLSGSLSNLGRSGQKAADLAVDRITAAIEATGADHSVQIVHVDNETSPEGSARAAASMVGAHGATCLVGAWTAEDTLETARTVSIPERVLQISPAPATDEITALDDDGLVNTVTPSTLAETDASAAFDELYRSSKPTDVQPRRLNAQVFDATVLCYLAAVAAGSADGKELALKLIDNTAPGGVEYGWEQLPEAIEALQDGEDIDYTGASGPIDMDVNGEATGTASSSTNDESGSP